MNVENSNQFKNLILGTTKIDNSHWIKQQQQNPSFWLIKYN